MAAIDAAKQVVYDLRGKVQEMTDSVLDRVNRSWEEQRPRIEAYMDAHPWVVFGGLILLAYLCSGNEKTHREATISGGSWER